MCCCLMRCRVFLLLAAADAAAAAGAVASTGRRQAAATSISRQVGIASHMLYMRKGRSVVRLPHTFSLLLLASGSICVAC